MVIKIKPIHNDLLGTCSQVYIRPLDIKVNEGIVFTVTMYFEVSGLEKSVEISGEEYNSWGADDHYIIDKVLEKLGLERDEVPEP